MAPGSTAAPVRGSNAVGAEGILDAALEIFREVGYGGASVREIASRANVTVAALYYHFPSKHAVLHTLMQRAMRTIIQQTENAVAVAPADDPVERFAAAVRAHVLYHTVHQVEAFVGNSELRSLEGQARTDVVALRDHLEELLSAIVSQGVEAGRFEVADVQHAARAVLAMCTSVASWYRPGGDLEPDQVADLYLGFSLKVVRAAV